MRGTGDGEEGLKPEEFVGKLRQAEVLHGRGMPMSGDDLLAADDFDPFDTALDHNFAVGIGWRRDSMPAICRRCLTETVSGVPRDPGCGCGFADLSTLLTDASAGRGPTMDGHAHILAGVHPGLPAKPPLVETHGFNPKPRMNNLHSNDS